MKTLKLCAIIIITALSLSVLLFTFDSLNSIDNSVRSLVWKQSVEQQLQEKTDQYQSEIYNRYNRIGRDLNSYQRNTNNRLDYIEDKMESDGITINNTNSNTQTNNE